MSSQPFTKAFFILAFMLFLGCAGGKQTVIETDVPQTTQTPVAEGEKKAAPENTIVYWTEVTDSSKTAYRDRFGKNGNVRPAYASDRARYFPLVFDNQKTLTFGYEGNALTVNGAPYAAIVSTEAELLAANTPFVWINSRALLTEANMTKGALKDAVTVKLDKRATASALNYAMLKALPKVRHLDMEGALGLIDAGLMHIAEIHDLEYLDLGFCSKITSAGFRAYLPRLKKLRALSLRGNNVNVDDATLIRALTELPALDYLDLSLCLSVTGAGLKNGVAKITTLTYLNLKGLSEITKESIIEGIALLPNLEFLSLAGCPIDDETLTAGVAKITSLIMLDITGTKVTATAVRKMIADLPNLRYITITRTAVDETGYADLVKAFPLVTIAK